MIDLLPYDLKKETLAARMNVVLMKYMAVLILAAGFMGYTVYNTKQILIEKQEVAKNQNNSNASSSRELLLLKQERQFKSSLAVSKNILDRQVSYAAILTKIANAMPQGTIIDSLALSDTTLSKPMTLKIKARTAGIEPTLKENFETSGLVSSYNLQSITSSTEGTDPGEYPINITLNVTINRVIEQ